MCEWTSTGQIAGVGKVSVSSGVQTDEARTRLGRPTFPVDVVRQDETLTALIHKIGHEIGNPLTAIISLATILERYPADQASAAKLATYAGSIIEEAWRISSLNERLVLLLSTRSGNPAPCDVGALCARALSRYKSRTKRKGLTIKSPEAVLPGGSAIYADSEQLTLLFMELLANAHQAMLYFDEESGVPQKSYVVTLAVEVDDDRVHVLLSNPLREPIRGDLSELFSPLVTHYEDRKHVGVGLTVAYSIVSRFDGAIEVLEESSPAGLSFTVRMSFPRAPAN